jgi:hypothetical protein
MDWSEAFGDRWASVFAAWPSGSVSCDAVLPSDLREQHLKVDVLLSHGRQRRMQDRASQDKNSID